MSNMGACTGAETYIDLVYQIARNDIPYARLSLLTIRRSLCFVLETDYLCPIGAREHNSINSSSSIYKGSGIDMCVAMSAEETSQPSCHTAGQSG